MAVDLTGSDNEQDQQEYVDYVGDFLPLLGDPRDIAEVFRDVQRQQQQQQAERAAAAAAARPRRTTAPPGAPMTLPFGLQHCMSAAVVGEPPRCA